MMRRIAVSLGALAVKAVLTLFGLLLVTFLIARVVPIDPVLAVVGDRASPEVYRRVRAEMGLDRPVAVQFWRYADIVARGDLGNSALTRSPVTADIARFFPATLELATAATLLGLLLGVPAGVVAAARHNRWPDHALRILSLFGYSVPVFWLGLMALLLFYADLGWAAGPGRLDPWLDDMVPARTGFVVIDAALAGNGAVLASALRHLALPALVLGYFSMAYISRMTRSLMLEQLGQDYITVARAKGLSEMQVLWRHALGNVWVPLATVATLAYAQLLEGSVLTETVFAWPGIGRYITGSLLSLDMNAVMGGTLVVGLVFILLNLLVEGIYPWLDPRAR
ncbi:MAG TPA: ABC transporter permease [Stellaceae bacterium]|nr:ABC transporter permease [Stellaceae bacterium]